MATIIWCDHVKHVVDSSRTEVAEILETVQEDISSADPSLFPQGFAYFKIKEIRGKGGQEVALNVRLISSFEAFPGDPI
jgi:hypothetical protein